MRFILTGSHILALLLKDWFKSKTPIQQYRTELQNWYWSCSWIIWYMFSIQCEELRINHLTPLLVVTVPYACWFLWRVDYTEDFKWCLHFNLGLRFEGLFWERYIVKAQIMFEGHWKLHSWTLITTYVHVRATSHTSQEPWPKNCESPIESVQRPSLHLQHHVVWSWTLKCSVKSYVTAPSTKCYFNESYSCGSSRMTKLE